MSGTATTHRPEASSVVKAIKHERKINRAPRENAIVVQPKIRYALFQVHLWGPTACACHASE